jgi:hypothetical protein
VKAINLALLATDRYTERAEALIKKMIRETRSWWSSIGQILKSWHNGCSLKGGSTSCQGALIDTENPNLRKSNAEAFLHLLLGYDRGLGGLSVGLSAKSKRAGRAIFQIKKKAPAVICRGQGLGKSMVGDFRPSCSELA